MRKINSIGYGGKIVAAACLFLIVIPLSLLALSTLVSFTGLKTCVYISLTVGILITMSLIILLAIELRQDRKINEYYRKHSHSKVNLGNGKYECQSCGSREVTVHDTGCRVCGIQLGKTNNVENRHTKRL